MIGSVKIDLTRRWGRWGRGVDRLILLQTRLPRVLLAAVVGAALATAGAALQGLLRNPLAEPHLIGVSGGAALGAVIAVCWAGAAPSRVLHPPLAAAAGACSQWPSSIACACPWPLAAVRPVACGVVYNAFAGALIMCVNAIADFYRRTVCCSG